MYVKELPILSHFCRRCRGFETGERNGIALGQQLRLLILQLGCWSFTSCWFAGRIWQLRSLEDGFSVFMDSYGFLHWILISRYSAIAESKELICCLGARLAQTIEAIQETSLLQKKCNVTTLWADNIYLYIFVDCQPRFQGHSCPRKGPPGMQFSGVSYQHIYIF